MGSSTGWTSKKYSVRHSTWMFGREQLHCLCAICAGGSNPDCKNSVEFQGCSNREYLAATHSWLSQRYRVNSWKEITYVTQQLIDVHHSVLRQKRSPHTLSIRKVIHDGLIFWFWSWHLLDLTCISETMEKACWSLFLQKSGKSFHKCLIWTKRDNTFSPVTSTLLNKSGSRRELTH